MMLTFFGLLSFNFWYDRSFDGTGHKRQVNAILGNLLRLYYPGVVAMGADRSALVIGWLDYARAPNARYGNAKADMRNAFWVSSYIFITSVTSCNI
jgi:hypothetical protein